MNIDDLNRAPEPRGPQLLYHFDGDLSETPVDRLAQEVRTRLESVPVPVRARSRLFASFVEMIQNVIHYAEPEAQPGGARRKGRIELGTDSSGYWIRCTNPVRAAHAVRLRSRLEEIRSMTPSEIASAYRKKLNQDGQRIPDPMSRGAGLGLLAIARNSSMPLTYQLYEPTVGPGPATFSLRATVNPASEIAR